MPSKSSIAPQRPEGDRASTRSLRPWQLLARLAREVGVDPARQHRVDLDVVGGPADRQRLGQLDDAALARAIGRRERRAEDRQHRADVDDLAAARALEVRIHGARADEGTGQVGVDHLLPLRHRQLVRRLADVDAGVVDRGCRCDRTAAAASATSASTERSSVTSTVERERVGAERLQLAHRGARLLAVACGHDHACTGLGQTLGHAPSRCRRCRR